jgi:hypothetical protein
MKKPVTLCLIGIALLLASGCASHRNTSTARELGVIDTIGDSQDKGYVEFYTKSANGLIPIYLIDQDNNSQPLAAVGVEAGDRYALRDGMRASERLRVAAPVGTHTFALQKGGQLIEVPVEQDKVTRVELDYDPVDNADAFVVYKLDYAVLDPVSAPAEAVGGAPRSE